MAHPLRLSADPENWRIFIARKMDTAFKRFRQRVLERDAFTCQYCGFQAKDYQEVVNLDGNYHNNTMTNMITACCFCTQCLFLESVGRGEYGGGTLLYLPEMSQPDLNALCHVLFCALSNATAYQSSAQSIYRSLKFRSQALEEQYGKGSSKPMVFGRLLIETLGDDRGEKQSILTDLRLLPSHAKFRQQIEAWASAALDEAPDGGH